MASGPITSRQIDGETVETVTDLTFLSSNLSADCDYTHKIKRCLQSQLNFMGETRWQRFQVFRGEF